MKKNNSLTILHVITTISLGGAEKQLLILCKSQLESGLEVKIVYLKGIPELFQSFKKLGVQIYSDCHNVSVLKQIINLRKIVKALGDSVIVHAHLPQAEFVSSFLSRTSKIVTTRHYAGNFHPRLPLIFSRFMSRYSSRNSNQIVAISQSVKKVLTKNREIDPKIPVSVVYYGYEKTSTNNEKEKDISKNGYNRLISIARLSKEKDYPTLFRALNIVNSNAKYRDSFILEIYGIGKEKNRLLKLRKELGLQGCIEFKGTHSNPLIPLKKADLFIHTSKFEGFGMVLLEAMDANLPIIASHNSAIIEVLEEAGAGNYFHTSNANELAIRVIEFFEGKIPVSNYIKEQNARLEFFNIKRMSRQLQEIYYEVLSR